MGRRPGWRREHRKRFWEAIASGLSSEEAAEVVGLASAVGTGYVNAMSTSPGSWRTLTKVDQVMGPGQVDPPIGGRSP